MNEQQTFFIERLNTAINKAVLNSYFFNTKINTLKTEIRFIKNVIIEQNLNKKNEKKAFNFQAKQINFYIKNLEQNQKNLSALYSQQKKLYSHYYDKNNISFLCNYLIFKDDKTNKIKVLKRKDENIYFTIDKRQNLSKTDFKLFLKKMLILQNITKREYKKAVKYSIISENIKARYSLYIRAKNKHGHKKYLLSNIKENRFFYEYSTEFKQLIKFRLLSPYFKKSFIINEIKQKKKNEKNIYSNQNKSITKTKSTPKQQ